MPRLLMGSSSCRDRTRASRPTILSPIRLKSPSTMCAVVHARGLETAALVVSVDRRTVDSRQNALTLCVCTIPHQLDGISRRALQVMSSEPPDHTTPGC